MDMDRQLSCMERDMKNCMRNLGMDRPCTKQLGYSGPSTESESGGEPGTKEPRKYALNIHLGGHVAPEDVKVSLKDHVMTVEAKKEFTSDDGNARMYQEFMRKFTIPDNVEMKEVKSVLTPEGYLKIEAPLPQEALPEPKKAQAIPIKSH
ncbi:unnamed protein product [Allacma fusca]|uniref:SHSP domain-containing protein n=1 Tax=Allacma fusca TaxID=39272 RepID=A0A8J2LUR0_9HEXA|nr:unnamed protein product [Allacma fusca]